MQSCSNCLRHFGEVQGEVVVGDCRHFFGKLKKIVDKVQKILLRIQNKKGIS